MRTSTKADPHTIAGSLYFDADGDGVRDASEVGVADVEVSFGARSRTTAEDGSFLFTDVSGDKTVRINTAWFRTQCNALDCDAGPGRDNDVAVENQLLFARKVDGDAGARIDVGLRPDWKAETGYPLSANPGDVNKVDVAVRLSRVAVEGSDEECERGEIVEHLCAAGDHPTASLAIHNQGTKPISEIVIAIESPSGLRHDKVIASASLPNPPNSNPKTMTPFDENTGTYTFVVVGPIPPAAVAYYDVSQVVDEDAYSSAEPYVRKNPYERQAYARVVSIAQGALEADSMLCDGWGDCETASGPHNKLENSDEMDESGWNVVAGDTVDPLESFELTAEVDGDGAGPTITIEFTNTGSEVLRNVQITAAVPPGIEIDDERWGETDEKNLFATRWPGQVSPGGTVSVTLELGTDADTDPDTDPDPDTDAAAGAVVVTVSEVLTGRHAEGPTPFPASVVDLDEFNAESAVVIDLAD